MANAPQFTAVTVAHPDDEMLWCGGQILSAPRRHWHVIALCRRSDADRAPPFYKVLRELGATGALGDLDDGPDQAPLDLAVVENTILGLLPNRPWGRVYTHGPEGEYTRHRRHEECCRAVTRLWQRKTLRTDELWMFAYTDDQRQNLPHVRDDADRRDRLSDDIFARKQSIVTDLYGFAPTSWEAQAVPREEGFWCFDHPAAAVERLERSEILP